MSVDPDRCSLRSAAADEPLAGTASTIRRWLLVEHPGPWGRDGLLDARLPGGVGAAFRVLERVTGARVTLIRRTGRSSPPGLRCYAVDTVDAWLGRAELDRIEDAVTLDPRDRGRFEPSQERLAVVCTHGRRDPCCAEQGRPLARATSEVCPDATWEGTHVGGDRFAGNLVAFPHGLYFGRVEPDRGPEIVRAYRDGEIAALDRYRGRASDPTHVQVADVALRARLGLSGLEDLRLEDRRRTDERAVVRFHTPREPWEITLRRTRGAPMRLTCHSDRDEAAATWRAVAITPVTAG